MAITGKSVKSLKKQDLINQKSPAVGFKKISFGHKATLNDTGFNLTTLNPPTELTSNGFSQATTAELASVSLQFYAKNLTLFSSARGYMVPFQDYAIGGNQQINFLPYFGNALADEIFYGTIDPVARTGSLVADTNFILKTGTLSAGAVDFNVGGSWKTNINPTQQLGAVNVYLDGVLQFRNSGNITAAPSADGNYQEVDNGSGECTLIRFNIADNLNDRVVMVMSNAISVIRPDGSINDSIEKIQGSLDAVISTVADLAGVATTNFNASPTTPQLKQFGDRLITLETNVAYENQANTWTVAQDLSTPGNKIAGRNDGVAVATGYIGEVKSVAQSGTITITTNANFVNIGSVLVPKGVWDVYLYAAISTTSSVTFGERPVLGFSSDSSTGFSDRDLTVALSKEVWSGIGPVGTSLSNSRWFASGPCVPINISVDTTYYLKMSNNVTAGTMDINGARLIFKRIA